MVQPSAIPLVRGEHGIASARQIRGKPDVDAAHRDAFGTVKLELRALSHPSWLLFDRTRATSLSAGDLRLRCNRPGSTSHHADPDASRSLSAEVPPDAIAARQTDLISKSLPDEILDFFQQLTSLAIFAVGL